MAKQKLVETVVFRAQECFGRTVVELKLRTGNPLPTAADPEYAHKLFIADAKTIVDALEASLPGGTLNQVLIELLLRHTSQLRSRCP
jgi:hypothetical protein